MKISYGRQFIDSKDKKTVLKTLSEELITQGNSIVKFENELKKYFSCKNVAAVSSGTAAMHLLALALGWGKKDIILMSPITFLSTANIVEHLGASIEFVDIDSHSYNICPKKLEEKIKLLNKKKLRAVVATDFAGLPCDWKKLKYLSKKYKFELINDNCHAIGANLNKNKSYGTDYALASVHSYHPVKNITTGEGGAVLSNNVKLVSKIKQLRSHGIEKRGTKSPWFYEVNNPGYNYRITDFQCALGISQLKKLKRFLGKRKKIASLYFRLLKDNKFIKFNFYSFPKYNSWHLFIILINFKSLKISKEKFLKKMNLKKIFPQVNYVPTSRYSVYRGKKQFKSSEDFYNQAISLPIFFDIKESQVKTICKFINKIIN